MSSSAQQYVLDFVQLGMTADGIASLCASGLRRAEVLRDEIKTLASAPSEELTWETTIGKMDEIAFFLGQAGSFAQLMGVAHPDEDVRRAALACDPKVSDFVTQLYLDKELASVFKRYADKKEPLSVARQRLLEFTLRDYRRNGLELDEDGQQRLRELNDELTKLGQAFESNLAETTLHIDIRPEQLEGLPETYVSSHPATDDGLVRITTDYPDYVPFMTYAQDRQVARELFKINANRAKDKNLPILDQLIKLRHEKARLLGYETWADYALEPRMAKERSIVRRFIDDLHTDLMIKRAQEMELFRAAWIKRGGGADEPIPVSDGVFLEDIVCKDLFSLDTKELRAYFEVDAVTQGILAISAQLYGISFHFSSAPKWHEDVIVLDVRDADQSLLGTVYLDLFPRTGKYKHAAVFGIRDTKLLADGSRVTPIAALVCNFPKPGEAPALLSHDEVVTYFHEFGHLLHHILSRAELVSFSGTSVARDFVEAPSQMFEEWAWSRETVDLFARHYKTGERIPDALFAAMVKARTFGMGVFTERQLFLSDLDFTYHTSEPGFSTDQVREELHQKYSSFSLVSDTHFQATFGHLVGYDAGYYGYQWALAIARDLFTRFEKEGIMNTKTAQEYRDRILAAGGEDDENNLVKHFLGRPFSNEAYKKYLGVK